MRQVILQVPADQVEVVSDQLFQLGASGLEERPGTDGQVALVAGDLDVAVVQEWVNGRWPLEVVEVDEFEWVESWKPFAAATVIAPGVVVRPPWVELPDDGTAPSLDVVIDPGRAWGHGAHPTTVLCAQALLEIQPPPGRVLDAGCGSGTLSVLAARLGATVTAFDVDPAAVAATRDNAAANGVGPAVTVTESDSVPPLDSPVDVVIANIGRGALEALATSLVAGLAAPGVIVLSGVLAADVGPLTAAFDDAAAAAFEWQVTQLDDWYVLRGARHG